MRQTCEGCGREFRGEGGLTWHRDRAHSQERAEPSAVEHTHHPWTEACVIEGCEHEAESFYVGEPSMVTQCDGGHIAVEPVRLRRSRTGEL